MCWGELILIKTLLLGLDEKLNYIISDCGMSNTPSHGTVLIETKRQYLIQFSINVTPGIIYPQRKDTVDEHGKWSGLQPTYYDKGKPIFIHCWQSFGLTSILHSSQAFKLHVFKVNQCFSPYSG